MSNESNTCKSNLALIYGSMLARLWLAVRAIQSGVEKFSGTKMSDEIINIDGKANEYGLTASESVKEYALSHYHGVPDALYKQFEGEPLMLGFALKIYNIVLGPALLVLGVAILLGIAYRTSLFALGLLYISLTWGLILLGSAGDPGVAWLGIHLVLIVMALMLAEHNRLAVLKKW
jgi:thiosulfate dehydrogenase (quinone) large subunit